MSVRYYGLLLALAASLSLSLTACGSGRPPEAVADPVTGKIAVRPAPPPDADNTDETLWTVLGFTKRESAPSFGLQTGSAVSPVLWEAALDTLNFAGIDSEDPVTGLLETKWYSPAGKPTERLRVTAFILSRALRSDSLSVTVERQEAASGGQWKDTPVARDVVTGLESAILQRARQIHAERYRNTTYN